MIVVMGKGTIKEGMLEPAKYFLKQHIREIIATESSTIEYACYTTESEEDSPTIHFYKKFEDEDGVLIHEINMAEYKDDFDEIFSNWKMMKMQAI